VDSADPHSVLKVTTTGGVPDRPSASAGRSLPRGAQHQAEGTMAVELEVRAPQHGTGLVEPAIQTAQACGKSGAQITNAGAR
jgi:hypothetical protein